MELGELSEPRKGLACETRLMAGNLMLYRESSSSCLSLCGFPWQEVVVQGLPGFSALKQLGRLKRGNYQAGH